MLSVTRFVMIFSVVVVISLLSGCGGGGSNSNDGDSPPDSDTSTTSNPPSPNSETSNPLPRSDTQLLSTIIGANFGTGTRRTVGLGPAFLYEGPNSGDLTTSTSTAAGGRTESGMWRDSQGRDGSVSAAELVRFLHAFQDWADVEGEGNLVIGQPVDARILRIGQGATMTERRRVVKALRILNTALPWAQRFQLGDSVELLETEDIPDDEIHLHFTNGQDEWPSFDEEYDENTLGVGGAYVNLETRATLGGYVYIDRTPALHQNPDRLLNTILHELLHARGILAHVDPNQYPQSILQPRNEPGVDTHLYNSIDGALLLAYSRLQVGTNIRDVNVSDFGDWSEEGFYIRGSLPLGGTNTQEMIGTVRYRNGLVTPSVFGPEPTRQFSDNPALGATATWTGNITGMTRATGRTVAGDAALIVNFDRQNGRAAFTKLESWAPRAHPGQQGSGTPWRDGDLAYTLTLWETGTQSGFNSTFAESDDPGVVTGLFVGTAHEGAAGVLEHPDMAANFGALREEPN